MSIKIVITSIKNQTLQDQVNDAIKNGAKTIILDGIFVSKTPCFSLLTIFQDIELIGKNNATLDGKNIATHLVYVDDGVKVKIKGITFLNGNTINKLSQKSLINHPKKRLNIFRYLDGGALSMGKGSEVVLENCEFTNNNSAVCGGAISNLGGYLQVKKCLFQNNSCGDTGAAIDNLATGSITHIEKSTFVANTANRLGSGTYGSVTVFPDTFLVIKDSDFTKENSTAIDVTPNKRHEVFASIDNATRFNQKTKTPVVKNPLPNKHVMREIIARYTRLFLLHPTLIKLEARP